MKIVMVAVSSVNGKTTKGEDPNIYSWTSKEDSQLFFSLIKENNLIVMGAKTYEAAKKLIKHEENKLRIILTRNPKKYSKEGLAGMLEFTNELPLGLIKKLETRGYKKMLLVGGSEVNALFLRSKLVNELHLTIEPKIFGTGKNLISEEGFNKQLKLINVKKLNSQGTLRLEYGVEN